VREKDLKRSLCHLGVIDVTVCCSARHALERTGFEHFLDKFDAAGQWATGAGEEVAVAGKAAQALVNGPSSKPGRLRVFFFSYSTLWVAIKQALVLINSRHDSTVAKSSHHHFSKKVQIRFKTFDTGCLECQVSSHREFGENRWILNSVHNNTR
jgi:hypothetical protein